MTQLTESAAWQALKTHHNDMKDVHMRHLFAQDKERFNRFSIAFNGILFDYSKNIITDETKEKLIALAKEQGLEDMRYLDGHYLLSLDGTGYFSSSEVHCDQCCEKHHRDGRITYYHQILGAVIVHPDQSEVFPLAPEPILKQDGAKKNDCERNAAKRFLTALRREHPHLKLIVQ